MSRSRRHKTPAGQLFLYIELSTLESNAYIALRGSAAKVYNVFRSIARGHLCTACSLDINLSHKTLEKRTGFSAQTVRDALIRLENLGFIDLVKNGGLKSAGQTCNIYRLSRRFEEYGGEGFKPGTMHKVAGSRNHCGFVAARKKQTPSTEISAALS